MIILVLRTGIFLRLNIKTNESLMPTAHTCLCCWFNVETWKSRLLSFETIDGMLGMFYQQKIIQIDWKKMTLPYLQTRQIIK